MSNTVYDLAIIGGGVNGTGIARDAAGRGLSVFLAEQNDLASGTSSASTKLIHGGLRYLEYYEFRLVREALKEREVLLAMAPHIIWPLRFILPHNDELRPAWLVRLGLFLYDNIGGRKRLPGTTTRRLDGPEDTVLKPRFTTAFEYSDCWVIDSRLTILNAQDAAQKGATIATRTKCFAARRQGDLWQVEVQDSAGETTTITARTLVNASGPWLEHTLHSVEHKKEELTPRMVKGSHIIVPKLFDHPEAYIFQNKDNRIIFAIPYEKEFTLIGTTDVDHKGQPDKPQISTQEIAYLCASANKYFQKEIAEEDVVHSFSGIRPLFNDGNSDAKAASRDYVLKVEDESGTAPLLSIYGGKITTYRKLAESVMDKLRIYLPEMSTQWTEHSSLPGGGFLPEDLEQLVDELRIKKPFLGPELCHRLVRNYGTNAMIMCAECHNQNDLGTFFGHGLYQREVEYLRQHEWAITAEDILERRTNLGLFFNKQEREILDQWLLDNQ